MDPSKVEMLKNEGREGLVVVLMLLAHALRPKKKTSSAKDLHQKKRAEGSRRMHSEKKMELKRGRDDDGILSPELLGRESEELVAQSRADGEGGGGAEKEDAKEDLDGERSKERMVGNHRGCWNVEKERESTCWFSGRSTGN